MSNPFVKKRNLEWSISPPPFRNADRRRREAEGQGACHLHAVQEGKATLSTEGGPEIPPRHELVPNSEQGPGVATENNNQKPHDGPSASALIENNTVKITDHLAWFSNLLTKATLNPFPAGQPQLPISEYQSLYNDSFHSSAGAHFVVTQHDHPIAGPHYDLRLQINGDSSCSWAIMYGYVYPYTHGWMVSRVPARHLSSDETQHK